MATPFPFLCGLGKVEWLHNLHMQTYTHTHPVFVAGVTNKVPGQQDILNAMLANYKTQEQKVKRSRSATKCPEKLFVHVKITLLHFYHSSCVKRSACWHNSALFDSFLTVPLVVHPAKDVFHPLYQTRLPSSLHPVFICLRYGLFYHLSYLLNQYTWFLHPLHPVCTSLHQNTVEQLGRCVCACFIREAHKKTHY